LQPGINYFYQLLAYNEHGNSPYTPVYGITAPLLDLPSAPSEFYSTAQSSTSVDLAWNDNSSREQGFKLYRSISETAGFAEVASCEANEISCTDRSLQSSATYFYRLRAFNTDGFSDYTPTIRVTTLVPGTPEPPPTEDTGNHNHGSIVYIDPENKSDQSANGSVEHPYNSWTNLVWIEGHSYLQKRGTTTTVGMIQIGANNVTLGSYGEGAIPVLNSTSTTYMISGFEKSGIEINNLSLNAPNAVSAVYFLGSSNDSIIIDHCTITGSRSAIKVMDASTLMVKYNILKGEQEGVFSTAEINVVNYNIFENSHSAINIMSNLSKASIFNNVFYNNTESVAVSYSDLTLYNNIFYLAENDHTALKLGTDKIKSDNNIYYPEQPGFISIGGKAYNNLDELQKTMKIDLNSFSSDPMFSDYVNENFRLKSKSPAINSGKNVQTTIDLEGTKVPLFGNTDIGAYEFSGNVSTPGELNNGEKINLKVFPNPTNGQITVEASLNEDNLSQEEPTLQSHELKVLDITGKILFTKNISFSNSVYQEKLDLSEFKSGLYFVIIRTADKIFKEKILLSR
jgi:hypothetical protein